MLGSSDASPSLSSLTAFKPRQVLLLQQRNRSASAPMTQLKPDDDSILVFSVALWLQNKGYSKVLKRFCSAAQIEGEDWKAKAHNLDEIFSIYQEISEELKPLKKQEEQVVDAVEKTANGEEIKGKKKKKRKSKDDTSVNESEEALNESHENNNEDESHKASKKSNGDKIPEVAEDQSTKKPKEKKKKKSKLASDADVKPEVTEQKQEVLSSEKAEAAEDGIDESKKASKKRKRMASNENESKSGEDVAIEESKSKKSKGLEANGHALQEDTENATDKNELDKSSQKKSASKQPKSSEPTTLKAFQRVKIDEVEFVDDRLQDNSYWAKDGAESGYGAKAQEVLGQVKGRGFRHEKTKKKRGSYRGGQIDLQSHSVKFNYSDEE